MFKRAFVRGLLTVTPIALTIGILVWLYDMIEGFVGKLYVDAFGPQLYFPGLGLIITLIAIFIIGILINNWLIKKAYEFFEKGLDKLPFIKTLYRSITDLMSFFKGNDSMESSRVVMIQYGESKIMGLVSRESFEDLPKGIGESGEVAVYIPMSYQIGGLTFVVPKSMVKPVDMGIEDALRFCATAGMPGQIKGDVNEKTSKKN